MQPADEQPRSTIGAVASFCARPHSPSFLSHCLPACLPARLPQLLSLLGDMLGSPALELNAAAGSALYGIAWEGAAVLLGLELGGRFPADKPAITLQSVR